MSTARPVQSNKTDLSLENTQIKAFFEGSDSYLPVAELLYVNSHPLLRPNFVSDIERIINRAIVYTQEKNVKSKYVDKIVSLTKKLGILSIKVDKDSAEEILHCLRDVYVVCNTLLNGHNLMNSKITR